jgi:hypothetical protein
MNKKGIGEKVILWVPRMIFLAIVMITIIFLTRFIVAIYVETVDAQATVYINKILYDKDGIIRYENGRPYPGVIVMGRFNEENLNSSMAFETEGERPCAKLLLKNLENDEETAIFWNKIWYERMRPRAAFRGIGSPYLKHVTVLVSVYENGRYVPATLNIDMVVPRK